MSDFESGAVAGVRANVWHSRRVRGFYAIVDPELCAGRDPRTVSAQILEGGCAVLQLRDKRGLAAARAQLARDLQRLCAQADVPFVVNDDVALAAELGAWGAHLGQHDLPFAAARALGPRLALGLSTHNRAQVDEACRLGADLIGFGPVFATASKARPDPVVGLDALREVVELCALPVVAIGGIGLPELPAVVATRVPLVAAIGAVTAANDPRAAAKSFHDALRSG